MEVKAFRILLQTEACFLSLVCFGEELERGWKLDRQLPNRAELTRLSLEELFCRDAMNSATGGGSPAPELGELGGGAMLKPFISRRSFCLFFFPPAPSTPAPTYTKISYCLLKQQAFKANMSHWTARKYTSNRNI